MAVGWNIEIIRKYFPDLTREQYGQFEQMGPLYQSWNERVNLVSRKDIGQLYLHHVLHSLAIAKWGGLLPGVDILDLGTGGGFPGIPLAVYYPQLSFILIDGTGKKIEAVRAIARQLELSNVEALQMRAEDLKAKFDHVVVRAVADTSTLIKWSRPLLKYPSSKVVLLKGGDLESELQRLPEKYHREKISLTAYFDESFFNQKYLVIINRPQRGVQI